LILKEKKLRFFLNTKSNIYLKRKKQYIINKMSHILGFERENIEIIDLYVKRVFTKTTKNYFVNANGSLRTIMAELLGSAHDIFGFEEGAQLELVEAGQQINNLKSEDAPAIELDSPEETFKQRFHNRGNNVSFYIRKV
jgi:hypothetical protein